VPASFEICLALFLQNSLRSDKEFVDATGEAATLSQAGGRRHCLTEGVGVNNKHMLAGRKRIVIGLLGTSVVLLAMFLPGLPWSAKFGHTIKRVIVRSEMRWARWRGKQPRFMAIAGRLNVPAAQIQALDSRSGWATLADNDGEFVLPLEMWYPKARYELVISTDDSAGRLIKVIAPEEYPENGVFRVGELDVNQGAPVTLASLIGFNSLNVEDFDYRNREYYQDLYAKLTAGKQTDEEKIDAVYNYVACKLNYNETQWELGTPRRVLEGGSEYCGHLSIAMQTLVDIGGYRARVIHMSDGKRPPGTHAVVEVFYADGWHLYDPTFGLKFLKKDGTVASYRDIRLDTSLISDDLLVRFTEKVQRDLRTLLPAAFGTGYHHYFYFQGEQWNASKPQHSF
jgi:transglutaminase-like putative cysteine protease